MIAADEVLQTYSPTLAAVEARIVARSSDLESWREYRKGGVTATFIRDVMKHLAGGKYTGRPKSREGAVEQVLRDSASFHGNQYTDYGNMREPIILDWVERRFSLSASDALIRHADFPQHLATPDGYGVDYDDRLRLVEVKTSKHSQEPGPLDQNNVLQMSLVDDAHRAGHFWTNGYYDQMQWQMWVTGADVTLFVWEQHDDQWPMPRPLRMEPEWCWVARDEERIAVLVEVANWYLGSREDLAEMRADRVADYEQLTADWRDAERRAKHWQAKRDAIKALIEERIGDVDEFTVDTDAAKVTLVQEQPRVAFSEALWAERAPKAYSGYLAAKERYTASSPGRRYVKITPHKDDKETGE